MKRLFILTYPKLTLYIIAVVIAYFIFQIPSIYLAVTSFDNITYLVLFSAGLLYSAGFTTPIATGFFLAANPLNLYLASLVA